MRVASLVLSVCLTIWGYCHGYLYIGLILAALIAPAPYLNSRLEFSHKQIMRMADLSIIAFAVVFYFTLSQYDFSFHYTNRALRWLPAVFFPLMIMHSFGTIKVYDIRSFLVFTRRKVDLDAKIIKYPIYLEYFFIAMTLMSTAYSERPWKWFFLACCLTFFSLFWTNKPKRHNRVVWLALMAIIFSIGFLSQHYMAIGQNALQKNAQKWFKNMLMTTKPIEYDQSTAIGKIGEIQQNHTIVGRVRPATNRSVLLKMSSYEFLLNEKTWLSHNDYVKEELKESYIINEGEETDQVLEMEMAVPGGTGYIPLPVNSHKIENLNVDHLYSLPNGGLRSVEGPEWLQFKCTLGSQNSKEHPPIENRDIEVDERIQKWLLPYIDKHFSSSLTNKQYIAAIARHFQSYSYTLKLSETPKKYSPLEYFLKENKKGHCEYYATATVLMLRLRGIPARYTVGYRMDEYSSLEDANIIRGSDAHAWVRAWNPEKKEWYNIDNTPGGPSGRSWHTSMTDIKDYLMYKFWKWRWSVKGQDQLLRWAPYVGGVLLIFLIWRIRRMKKNKRNKLKEVILSDDPLISEKKVMNKIHHWFEIQSLDKRASETYPLWIQRLSDSNYDIPNLNELQTICKIYCQCIYDPRPIPSSLKTELAERCETWLKDVQNINLNKQYQEKQLSLKK